MPGLTTQPPQPRINRAERRYNSVTANQAPPQPIQPQGGGMQRVSPGVYRNPDGSLQHGQGNSQAPVRPQTGGPSQVGQAAGQAFDQFSGQRPAFPNPKQFAPGQMPGFNPQVGQQMGQMMGNYFNGGMPYQNQMQNAYGAMGAQPLGNGMQQQQMDYKPGQMLGQFTQGNAYGRFF